MIEKRGGKLPLIKVFEYDNTYNILLYLECIQSLLFNVLNAFTQ